MTTAHVFGEALTRQIQAQTPTGVPLPVADLSRVAASAWRQTVDTDPTDKNREDRAITAVVHAAYRLGLDLGRPLGVAAVVDHITHAAQSPVSEPGDHRTSRQLVDRLTRAAAAHRTPPPAGELADRPLPRTYLAAFGNGSTPVTVDRIAHAATIGWLHGFEDGWRDAHQVVDDILNPIRDSKQSATSVAATPTLAWLNDLAASAHHVAEPPHQHPAALAKLAAAVPTTSTTAPDQQRQSQTHPASYPQDDAVRLDAAQPVDEAAEMDYTTALNQASTRLQTNTPNPDTEIQAALRLACLAFDTADPPDRAWALLGLDLLTALADLYPDPDPIALHVTAPATADPPVRAAVTGLVRTLADTFDHLSAQPQLPTHRRIAFAGAAAQLRTTLQGRP